MRGLILGWSRRRIVNDFVAARATVVDRAIVYDPQDARTFRWLCGYGAIVDDGKGRYHLDAARLGAFRGAVRRRIAVMIVTALGLFASGAAAMTVFALAE